MFLENKNIVLYLTIFKNVFMKNVIQNPDLKNVLFISIFIFFNLIYSLFFFIYQINNKELINK